MNIFRKLDDAKSWDMKQLRIWRDEGNKSKVIIQAYVDNLYKKRNYGKIEWMIPTYDRDGLCARMFVEPNDDTPFVSLLESGLTILGIPVSVENIQDSLGTEVQVYIHQWRGVSEVNISIGSRQILWG
jgi:hypothetical protein